MRLSVYREDIVAETSMPIPAPKKRIDFSYNLKGVLIILVVIGHFLLPVHNDNAVITPIYYLIYVFHMPLFVFVSGFFAASIFKNGRLRSNKIFSMLLMAALFQLTIMALKWDWSFDSFLNFNSAPWYLVSLACWNLLVPLFLTLKPKPAIIGAFALALLAGCCDGLTTYMSLVRTVGFLPFFLMGMYCTKEQLSAIKESSWLKWVALAAVAFMVWYCIFGTCTAELWQTGYYNSGYTGSNLVGMAARTVMFAIAVLMSLALLFVMPSKHTFLCYLGERTLQIYILHRIIRQVFSIFGFFKLPVLLDPVWGPVILIALSLAVVAVCSIDVIRKPFDAIMGIKWNAIIKPAA